jgi:hypothetical protein
VSNNDKKYKGISRNGALERNGLSIAKFLALPSIKNSSTYNNTSTSLSQMSRNHFSDYKFLN